MRSDSAQLRIPGLDAIEAAIRAAGDEGQAIGEAGVPREACPYSRSQPDRRRAWMLGWIAGRVVSEAA